MCVFLYIFGENRKRLKELLQTERFGGGEGAVVAEVISTRLLMTGVSICNTVPTDGPPSPLLLPLAVDILRPPSRMDDC